MKRKLTSWLLLGVTIFLSSTGMGCYKPEPGPAERIGRSIDELSKGVRDLGKEWEDDEEREREERRRRRESDDLYGDRWDSRDDSGRGSINDSPYSDTYRDDQDRDGEDDARPLPPVDRENRY